MIGNPGREGPNMRKMMIAIRLVALTARRRQGRKVRPGRDYTAARRYASRSGMAAFDELRQGVKDIEFLADPTAGEVRIAALITNAIPRRRHRQIRATASTRRLSPDHRRVGDDFPCT
jgi:hypothetical protein